MSSNIKVLTFASNKWNHDCANLIMNEIDNVLSKRSECNLVLTGGETASKVYKEMGYYFNNKAFIHKINIYFTDERCVPTGFNLTNYELVIHNLFQGKVENSFNVQRINGAALDISSEAQRYSNLLNNSADIVILSLANDGHIASLFEINPSLKSMNDNYIPVIGKLPFVNRISISPKFIEDSKKIFVFAKGFNKVQLLKKMFWGVNDCDPISLLFNATWIIEKSTERFLYEE